MLAAVGVTLILLYTWLFGSDRRALAFSRAEATWPFPAPVTRAQLIRYKLLRGQFVVLFNVLLWTFLLSRDLTGGSWRRAAAIWVLLTTLTLHRLGAALLKASLWEHGAVAVRARAVSLTALAGVATGRSGRRRLRRCRRSGRGGRPDLGSSSSPLRSSPRGRFPTRCSFPPEC